MRADKMIKQTPVRMLLTGYPGSGKTACLAALANAGFKLRVLDYDGNPEALLLYTKPECLQNIDIVTLEDNLINRGDHMGVSGLPAAFTRGVALMDRWRYEDSDGEPELDKKGALTGKRFTDLGKSDTWGLDTVVVCDGLTGLTAASLNRAQALMNKTPRNRTRALWGLAGSEQLSFIKKLTHADNTHHTIVISHLKLIGPRDIEEDDEDETVKLKKRLISLVPTRLYPTAVGQDLAKTVAGEFPVHVNLEVEGGAMGRPGKRLFSIHPRADMDLKLPVRDIARLGKLGVEDGMRQLFEAMGHPAPNGTPALRVEGEQATEPASVNA